jgi:hypothetical protein
MDIFTPVVPEEQFHAHFKSVLDPARHLERRELERWIAGFPDRDNKFVREFQTTFNSSFWEIYLFALLSDYDFSFDWSHPAPDFSVQKDGVALVIEAATANAADGKNKEWEKEWPTFPMHEKPKFWNLNREAMIRLSNALLGKLVAYRDKYAKLPHVRGKPFVIAVAPFEQPHFQYQYDRPIQALLYDYYVDEDAYNDNPGKFPNGPPGVKLGFVDKENGAQIPLGIFLSEEWSEVSAVIFSCTATWGKVDVMSGASSELSFVESTWGSAPNGAPVRRSGRRGAYTETITDGLQIFHNPRAKSPLPVELFRRLGVVQHYFDRRTGNWIHEGRENCLHMRLVLNLQIAP